jgi:hypothetical protein
LIVYEYLWAQKLHKVSNNLSLPSGSLWNL